MATLSISDLPEVLDVADMLQRSGYMTRKQLSVLVRFASGAAGHFQNDEVWKDDAIQTAEIAKTIRRRIKETTR